MKKEVDPKKAMPLEELLQGILEKGFIKEIIPECSCCHKKFSIDSEDFITIYGNITVGLKGGIVGNHFDSDGKLFRLDFFCRDIKCLPKYIINKRI
jgi:hypothetical protein